MAGKTVRNSETEEEGQQQHLQDGMIAMFILTKFPIKALTQFKVISKLLYSSLSSPNFILHYTKQPLFSHPGPPLESLFIQFGHEFYLFSCANDDNIPEYNDYIEEINQGSILNNINNNNNNLIKLDVEFDFDDHLVGCSNGLVCLAENHGKYFVLYNPKTNESYKYCPGDSDFLDNVDPFVAWGFGYVSSIDDYKVVRIMLMRHDGDYGIAHVFSLKTNTWRRVKLDLFTEGVLLAQAKLANDTLYWTKFGGSEGIRTMGFDLASETFHWFPHVRINSVYSEVLCVMGGCLSKCRSNAKNEVIVDIVKSPGRVISVCLSCDVRIRRNDEVIGFTKTGKVFVAHDNCRMISMLDCGSKRTLIEFKAEEWEKKETRIQSYIPTQTSPLPSTPSSTCQGTWAYAYEEDPSD